MDALSDRHESPGFCDLPPLLHQQGRDVALQEEIVDTYQNDYLLHEGLIALAPFQTNSGLDQFIGCCEPSRN
ncbi:hypothetical protein E2C01_036112 [Portunus trituberculatus]|uniref:Uncharacterized protein n=1 Tax=Portunus trituberculatus TaxID=210409 RepID=A0A5B7F5Y9_PORTR|nr:hypothetical protein [Portunus trituberculatus]